MGERVLCVLPLFEALLYRNKAAFGLHKGSRQILSLDWRDSHERYFWAPQEMLNMDTPHLPFWWDQYQYNDSNQFARTTDVQQNWFQTWYICSKLCCGQTCSERGSGEVKKHQCCFGLDTVIYQCRPLDFPGNKPQYVHSKWPPK